MPKFPSRIAAAALVAAAAVAGCDEPAPPAPQARPVRAVTVERRAEGETASLTGQVRARDQASLAFRLDGRVLERPVNVGDALQAGQLVARLDPQDQQNALRSAQASLAAAEATLTQTRLAFWRQQELLRDGWTPRARFDDAQQAYLSAQARVTAAQAQAAHRGGRARLHDACGRRPGRGHREGRRTGRGGPRRADDRAARARGRTRRRLRRARGAHPDGPARPGGADHPRRRPEGDGHRPRPGGRAPGGRRHPDLPGQGRHRRSAGGHAAGLHRHRPRPARGAPGRGGAGERAHRSERPPAVWVFDTKSQTVSLRNVDVARYDPVGVVVSRGLEAGEVVVTAGVQVLRPGQKVRLLGAAS